MRNPIFTLATFFFSFFCLSTLYGQSEKKLSKPSFGILAGATLSNISNYEAENRLGFVIGLYVERSLTEKLSLLLNFSYAQRGAIAKDGLSSIKLDYLTIPIMINYNISDKIGIFTGIAWDALLTVSGDGLVRNDLREDDWRVPVGLGYNISRNMKVGIAYHFGLTDITKNDSEILRNNWGSIAIAYVFKKKKN